MSTRNQDTTKLQIDVDGVHGTGGASLPRSGGPQRPRVWIAAAAVLVAVLGVLAVILVVGLGGEDPQPAAAPTVAEQQRNILAGVDRPLDRLNRALVAARPSRRASMITLAASADRAGTALGQAGRDLDRLGDTAPVRDRADLRETSDALQEVRALADALAAPRVSLTEVQLASTKARQAGDDAGLELPPLRTAALVGAVRKARRPKPATVTSDGTSVPVGAAPSASTAPAASPLSFFTYDGPAFQAQLPQGTGWGTPAQSQPTPGELFRTSVRGPNGLFVIVDYTPFETARFSAGYTSRETVGQTAFGSGTRYVFSGGRLPECQRGTCIDYILNDASTGSGFGVLAGGGDPATVAALARTVAESVVPTDG